MPLNHFKIALYRLHIIQMNNDLHRLLSLIRLCLSDEPLYAFNATVITSSKWEGAEKVVEDSVIAKHALLIVRIVVSIS